MDYIPPGSLGVPKQEYWRGLPLPIPGDFPHLVIELGLPALQVDFLPLSDQGSLCVCVVEKLVAIHICSLTFHKLMQDS